MTQSAVAILGKRIKDLRLARGWTQAGLAEVLGCESMTVSRYERGEYAPSVDVLAQIASALNIKMEALFVSCEQAKPTTASLRHDLCDIAYQANEELLGDILIAARKILAKRN